MRRFARSLPGKVAGFVFITPFTRTDLAFSSDRSALGARAPADPLVVKRNGGLSPGELLIWHYDKPLIVLEHGIPLTFEGPLAAHTAKLNAAVDSMARDLASRSSM